MKKKWNAKKKSEVEQKNGDLVWVDMAHYNTDQPSKKLFTKWLGLFPIIRKVGKSAYKLKILSTWKSIHPVVNESYLISYVTPIFEQQSQRSDNKVANPCHDLTKWPSHYLYFFFFSFLFLLDLQDRVWESITWLCHNVTDGHSHSHSVSHD